LDLIPIGFSRRIFPNQNVVNAQLRNIGALLSVSRILSDSASNQIRIGSVVIDCINYKEMLAFWKEALHYVTRGPLVGGWTILRDPSGRNTNVSLNRVSVGEKLTGRNWLHFDLYTDERDKEVERLLRLGARRHPQTYGPEDDFIVLEDPDGNLFCIVDTSMR
jgi:Glyoxalase-like domain